MTLLCQLIYYSVFASSGQPDVIIMVYGFLGSITKAAMRISAIFDNVMLVCFGKECLVLCCCN